MNAAGKAQGGSGSMTESAYEEQPRGFDDYQISLGDILRGERATLGKTLLDVQDDLRIKSKYLAAIENCDADAFETSGFVAGYVRSYARYLNLDADQVFETFCAESGFEAVNASMAARGTAKPQSRSASLRPNTQGDPILSATIANRPAKAGMFDDISLAGIGSVFVLLAMVGGLTYGGWRVLEEVQRVQFAPTNDAPGLAAAVDPLSAQGQPMQDEKIVIVGEDLASNSQLQDLYRPQELELPQLVSRDGPISEIDPDVFGTFAMVEEPIVPIDPIEVETVVVAAAPPPVDVYAVKPAWVRIFMPDGTILFEQILDAGDRYRVPPDLEGPLLRAGNSGSVYLQVGDETYGPVGKGNGVARKVALSEPSAKEKYELVTTGLVDAPSSPPVNAAALLTRETSE
jgi:hypothetical protein